MALRAWSVGVVSFLSMDFSAVPATAPFTPLLARSARAALVSCRVHPMLAAMSATFTSDCPRPVTSVVDRFAAFAKTSATIPASLAFRLNCERVLAVISAAWATESSPAAARSRVPARDAMVCSMVKPALMSSFAAWAVSPAENAVSLPSWRTTSRSLFISAAVPLALAFTRDISYSKEAAVLMA